MVSLSRSTKETHAGQTKGKTDAQIELTRVHQSVSTRINKYQRRSKGCQKFDMDSGNFLQNLTEIGITGVE